MLSKKRLKELNIVQTEDKTFAWTILGYCKKNELSEETKMDWLDHGRPDALALVDGYYISFGEGAVTSEVVNAKVELRNKGAIITLNSFPPTIDSIVLETFMDTFSKLVDFNFLVLDALIDLSQANDILFDAGEKGTISTMVESL